MRQDNGTPAAPPVADSMARALEEYLAAAEAGTAPPREQLLARYPELAEDLDACLAALRFIGRAAEGPRSVVAQVTGAEPPELASGQLGDFRLIREAGRGGMGVVYEAEQISLRRRVALKVLPFAATMDPRHLQRFHNEARAAACLHHEHIVPVYSVGSERGVHYYAMQFIDGRTLAAVIRDLQHAKPATAAKRPAARQVSKPAVGAEPPTVPHVRSAGSTVDTPAQANLSTERLGLGKDSHRRVAELGVQAALALEHAHERGIVHRDIKPGNLLLDERGSVWVTDFGLAQLQHGEGNLTLTGDLLGTLRYMSPEQALARRVPIDHRTDVYSLGATLYELLTLRPAFGGSDRQELLRQVAFEEPVAPRRLDRGIPAELETIVLKAMEKNPADRYQTAQELADDLSRFLDDHPIRARPASVARRLRKWGRRHPAWVAAVAAALTAAVVVLSAGLGWVARDRATRRQVAEQAVAAAWEESLSWQRQRRLPESLSAAQRAAELAAWGEVEEDRRRQVDARVADLKLLERLENVRLEYALTGQFDNALADRLFRAAFQEAALDVDALPAPEAGNGIRSTTVAAELAAALDHWAYVRRPVRSRDDPGWRHLLQVARVADPDPWRVRVRDELERQDPAALRKLAASEKVFGLLPATLTCLVHALRNTGAITESLALAQEMQRRHSGDFWANEDLGLMLKSWEPPDLEGAIRFCTAAVAIRPQSSGAHNNLGVALKARGKVEEAIACYRKAIALDPKFAGGHNNLGTVLQEKGQMDEAIASHKQALALDPKLAMAHTNLGVALYRKGKVDEAIACYHKAIALDPKYAHAHSNLGSALYSKGKVDEAIACHKQAIALDPKYAMAHNNLGAALRDKGKVDEAIACYHKAIALDPKYAIAHFNLGNALYHRGDLEGAIAQYRKAIRLKKDHADAHSNLGTALIMRGDVDEAIIAYRQAIQLRPDFVEGLFNLGFLLRDKGQFAEALIYLRRAHELRSTMARWPYPSAQWVKECERFLELEPHLPAILSGKAVPAHPGETAEYARLCHKKHRFVSAARLYRQAITANPGLATADNGFRYDAACAAIQAGSGAGEEAARLNDADRATLRKQALDWLRTDLQAWRDLLDREPARSAQVVARKMQHWQRDPDFNSVRRPDALARLPEAERVEWSKLWTDVAATLRRAAGRPPQPRDGDGKP
jgi:tetratricopeptide (TPR) repeat protein